MARQTRARATKKHALALMREAQECHYLPPPNSGKVPKGTVLKGLGEYDHRQALLHRAATEWLRASKRVGHTAITDQPYRKVRGKSQSVGTVRMHGAGPSTTL